MRKLKRVTIPIYDDDYQILMISFDRDVENEYIILEKVLSLLKNANILILSNMKITC
jgi:hypothetical protein